MRNVARVETKCISRAHARLRWVGAREIIGGGGIGGVGMPKKLFLG